MNRSSHETSGKAYWRSLEELADSAAFRAAAEHEFPAGFFDQLDGVSRRRFLKVMGASLALAGVAGATGCRRWETRQLAPQSSRPEGTAPGQRQAYATAFEIGGVAQPVLVSAFDGRPVKIEGNPLHPQSRGAASIIAQASVLEFYDPERSQRPRLFNSGKRLAKTRQQFLSVADDLFAAARDRRGAGVAILSEATSSPTVAATRKQMVDRLPEARWHTYEPVNRDNELAGAKLAFGRALRTHPRLDRAQIIACFDSDLLMRHPAAIGYARDWANGRRSADAAGTMNRLYVVEGAYTITGGAADHRLAVRPSQVGRLLAALLKQLRDPSSAASTDDSRQAAFIKQLANDLREHRGSSVVSVGPQQPPEVHALGHQINAELGNVGATVTYTDESDADAPADHDAIASLASDLNNGKVELLLILGGNAAYDAPSEADFPTALSKAKTSIHLSLYDNETSRLCTWHVPRAHWLEAWGDCRAFDGTITIAQPLIQPLYDGLSSIELLTRLVDARGASDGGKHRLENGYDLVRETHRSILPAGSFEVDWQQALFAGVVAGSAFPKTNVKLVLKDRDALEPLLSGPAPAADALEALFVADYSVHDGRFANNGWLQELPDPISKLTWDNAAAIAPATAQKFGIVNGDVVTVQTAAGSVEIAALIAPGTAPGVVVLPLGYGRTFAGHVGNKVGFDVYPLRVGGASIAPIRQLSRTGRTYTLALTEQYHAIETDILKEKFDEQVGELVRQRTLSEYRQHPHFAGSEGKYDGAPAARSIPLQLWEDPIDYDKSAPHQWGMSIDLSACIGCNACIVACQAENNIPIVGKQEVNRGRAMHWIRVDRYFQGEDADEPGMAFQPVTCHHCENAPCEQVCPVGATVHDSEGLNAMVYNRCVGTRYCSNNCPYKVRRFNYFDWHSRDPRTDGMTAPFLGIPDQQQARQVNAVKQMVYNPDVSVRMRGVMEKCTFCVQRIKSAEQHARTEHAQGQRPDAQVRDGEVQPACAQTCPTQAITFGNLRDPQARVRQLRKQNPRTYTLLDELNVRPRTSYLARLKNPADGLENATDVAHGASKQSDREG